MLGRGHISENALSSALSMYSILIAFVLKDYNAAFLCNCGYLLFLLWGY